MALGSGGVGGGPRPIGTIPGTDYGIFGKEGELVLTPIDPAEALANAPIAVPLGMKNGQVRLSSEGLATKDVTVSGDLVIEGTLTGSDGGSVGFTLLEGANVKALGVDALGMRATTVTVDKLLTANGQISAKEVEADSVTISDALTVQGPSRMRNLDIEQSAQVGSDFIVMGQLFVGSVQFDVALGAVDDRIGLIESHLEESVAVSLGRISEALDQIRGDLELDEVGEGPIFAQGRPRTSKMLDQLDERVRRIEQKVGLPTPPPPPSGGPVKKNIPKG